MTQIMWCAVFFWLMGVGVFRLCNGKSKLKADAAPDDRCNKIPDEDVREHFKYLIFLNKKFGKFYIYYGLFLIVTSIFNIIIILLNKAVEFSLFPIYSWLFGVAVGFFIVGDRKRNFNIQAPIRLPTRLKTSFDFLTERHFLYNAYAQYQFLPQQKMARGSSKNS